MNFKQSSSNLLRRMAKRSDIAMADSLASFKKECGFLTASATPSYSGILTFILNDLSS